MAGVGRGGGGGEEGGGCGSGMCCSASQWEEAPCAPHASRTRRRRRKTTKATGWEGRTRMDGTVCVCWPPNTGACCAAVAVVTQRERVPRIVQPTTPPPRPPLDTRELRNFKPPFESFLWGSHACQWQLVREIVVFYFCIFTHNGVVFLVHHALERRSPFGEQEVVQGLFLSLSLTLPLSGQSVSFLPLLRNSKLIEQHLGEDGARLLPCCAL
uniref:Uncharacterized protein n=1 Tax=Physcomitrium patens TaxID=3218 RepID=A0A2K1JS00_PHYPA|nr:hypothetical protein PHYPA_016630 [Physcomitrium patens]